MKRSIAPRDKTSAPVQSVSAQTLRKVRWMDIRVPGQVTGSGSCRSGLVPLDRPASRRSRVPTLSGLRKSPEKLEHKNSGQLESRHLLLRTSRLAVFRPALFLGQCAIGNDLKTFSSSEWQTCLDTCYEFGKYSSVDSKSTSNIFPRFLNASALPLLEKRRESTSLACCDDNHSNSVLRESSKPLGDGQ